MKTIIKIAALSAVLFCILHITTSQLSNAQSSGSFSLTFTKELVTIGGMEYLFVYTRNTSQTGHAISVTNITKDKLEIEVLKLQLKTLK